MLKAAAINDLQCFYVVFQDEVSLWWLRLLKRGFRHCYVLVPMSEEGGFLELNPYSNVFILRRIKVVAGCDYLALLRREGRQVCAVKSVNLPKTSAPAGVFTCVEFVKRMLGIHSRRIITPYQLYKNIKDCRKKVLTR